MLKKTCLIALSLFVLASCKGGPSSDTSSGVDWVNQYTEGFDEVRQTDLRNSIGDKVYFAFDQSSFDEKGKETLRRQADWWRNNGMPNLIIEGHCDERGTREYNLALGERRANSVKNYLINLGVDPNKIETISYGKEKPWVMGEGEDVWKLNRRSVTVIIR